MTIHLVAVSFVALRFRAEANAYLSPEVSVHFNGWHTFHIISNAFYFRLFREFGRQFGGTRTMYGGHSLLSLVRKRPLLLGRPFYSLPLRALIHYCSIKLIHAWRQVGRRYRYRSGTTDIAVRRLGDIVRNCSSCCFFGAANIYNKSIILFRFLLRSIVVGLTAVY